MRPLPSPALVVTDQQLQTVIARLRDNAYFAIDTEFVRTDTFYPNLGLIQLSDGEHCWLIDPLEKLDFAPLVALLECPSTIKIFHSCSEDLEVLNQCLHCLPQPIFDSQIAAALCGHGFSRGYAALIEEVVGVPLGKHETRSDWLQRPLTLSQQQYAAEDVYYLVYLYRHLEAELHTLGREHWMFEEMRRLTATVNPNPDPALYYQKVKGAWKLNQRALAVLRSLCDWREREARARNRPRRRIIDDRSLWDIAINQPRDFRALSAAVKPGLLRRHGKQLLALVEQSLALDETQLPEPLPKPVPREAGGMIKQLRELVAARAEQLNIPAEMLARRVDLEELMRAAGSGQGFPERLTGGWRGEILAKPIQELLHANR